jgi:hypothetical protein
MKPFDPELSYRLDAVIIPLDFKHSWPVRVVLRLYKRFLERGI